MPGNWILFTVLFSSLLLVGCESPKSDDNADYSSHYETNRPGTLGLPNSQFGISKYQALFAYFDEWKGTPYRYGGASKHGIDCSAFTQQAFLAVYEHSLPRTTRQQIKVGDKITLATADHGDLIFFKTGANRYHVGIYIGENEFMHASSSKGVTISRIDNPYWSKRVIDVRRYPLQ
ncbi:C40 family peptidase [Grimontia marina]|uniref:Murein DD-endopeptidase MepS/Murein LD-carboxypeptidase n=1 Tax=Grimontia marina TaxID=646534 RepID=A0A128FBU7_9GAMM|nr:NlpC/P60 family protein [Grimontia marina]CZF84277.1 Murein DD-endopeptidase MepS/Murein LD-carboxypeptidase precursor [Grimontia marina]